MNEAERLQARQWVEAANTRYRDEHIPPRERPFRALHELAAAWRCTIAMDSELAEFIFEYFRSTSKPGSHEIGVMFTGAFYFDASFWPLRIPFIYGLSSLDPLSCVDGLPTVVKAEIERVPNQLRLLEYFWADCCDYALGCDDLFADGQLCEKARNFLQNGDRELRSATAQLLLPQPMPRAILSLRFAYEIFLKVVLIQEKGYDDKKLMDVSHDLVDAARKCCEATQWQEFSEFEQRVEIFSPVKDRYEGQSLPLSELWEAVQLTQKLAATVTRFYTDRNVRAQVEAKWSA